MNNEFTAADAYAISKEATTVDGLIKTAALQGKFSLLLIESELKTGFNIEVFGLKQRGFLVEIYPQTLESEGRTALVSWTVKPEKRRDNSMWI